MSDTLRNGMLAFAMAAVAVIAISVGLLLATNNGGDSDGRVGDATSVTPAVLGESQGPTASLTPTPTP